MDGVTRELRASGRLPKGGRGTNAPRISPKEAATTLIAVAGSSKANEANSRLDKLEPLRSSLPRKAPQTLIDSLTAFLGDEAAFERLLEVRIARTRRRASFHFRDGTVEEFLPAKPDGRRDRFYVEGILPAALLQLVARAMDESGDITGSGNRDARAINRSPGRGKS